MDAAFILSLLLMFWGLFWRSAHVNIFLLMTFLMSCFSVFSCFSILFCSSTAAVMTCRLVSSTMPPITSSSKMWWICTAIKQNTHLSIASDTLCSLCYLAELANEGKHYERESALEPTVTHATRLVVSKTSFLSHMHTPKERIVYLVHVEDEIQLAHIFKGLVQWLHKYVYQIEDTQLALRGINTEYEIQRCIMPMRWCVREQTFWLSRAGGGQNAVPVNEFCVLSPVLATFQEVAHNVSSFWNQCEAFSDQFLLFLYRLAMLGFCFGWGGGEKCINGTMLWQKQNTSGSTGRRSYKVVKELGEPWLAMVIHNKNSVQHGWDCWLWWERDGVQLLFFFCCLFGKHSSPPPPNCNHSGDREKNELWFCALLEKQAKATHKQGHVVGKKVDKHRWQNPIFIVELSVCLWQQMMVMI